MSNAIFKRGDDFIKFVDGKTEFSSPAVQALWEDLVQKELNDEWGPHGTYIAQCDIVYEGFTLQSL